MGITPRFLIELVKEEFVKASGKWRTFVTCFDTFTNVLFMGLGKDLERSERCTFTNGYLSDFSFCYHKLSKWNLW